MKVESYIGMKLKRLRFDANINQKTLAGKLDLTASYISAIENGLKMPSMDVVEKWAKELGYTVAFAKVLVTNKIKINDNDNRQENGHRNETGEIPH